MRALVTHAHKESENIHSLVGGGLQQGRELLGRCRLNRHGHRALKHRLERGCIHVDDDLDRRPRVELLVVRERNFADLPNGLVVEFFKGFEELGRSRRFLTLTLEFPKAVLRADCGHEVANEHLASRRLALVRVLVLVFVGRSTHPQHPLSNLPALRRQFSQRL